MRATQSLERVSQARDDGFASRACRRSAILRIVKLAPLCDCERPVGASDCGGLERRPDIGKRQLEELLFGVDFGMYWSSVCEHVAVANTSARVDCH